MVVLLYKFSKVLLFVFSIGHVVMTMVVRDHCNLLYVVVNCMIVTEPVNLFLPLQIIIGKEFILNARIRLTNCKKGEVQKDSPSGTDKAMVKTKVKCLSLQRLLNYNSTRLTQ